MAHKYLNRYEILYFIPLCLLLIFTIAQTLHFKSHDFANYYFGGHFINKGLFDQDIYNAALFNQKLLELGFQNQFVNYTPNTPFAAIFFSPFAFLELIYAKLIFNILSIVVFIYTLKRTVERFRISKNIVLLVPFLFLIPIRNNILFGQQYLILYALLMEGYIASSENKHAKSSLFWALSIFFKVFPLIIFAYLLFNRKFKAFAYLASACLLLLTLSILVIKPGIWQYYLFTILPQASSGEVMLGYVQNYQSGFMFFKYLLVENELYNPHPIFNNWHIFLGVIIIFKSIILSLAIDQTEKKDNKLIIFSIWIVAGLLISPYGNTSSLILFLVPLIAWFINESFNWKFMLICGLIILIANLPVAYFRDFPTLFAFPRLYLIFSLFILILPHKRLSHKVLPLVFLFFCLTSAPLFVTPKDESEYFLKDYQPALIVNYHNKNGKLQYKYWTDEGIRSKETDIKVQDISCDDLNVEGGQIFYKNKQLTFSKDHKLNPCLLNGKEIIYLSDKGNGPGFYQLRKLVGNDHIFSK